MKAEVRLEFATPADAETAAAALLPDNDGHIEQRLEDRALVLVARSDSVMGLLRSLDDALACLRAAGFE